MRRFSGSLVMVTLLSLLLTACGTSNSSATGPQKLTVGYIPVMIDAPLYVGIERGYFKDAGLDLTIQPIAGGTDVITQTAAGNFDAALGGLGVATYNAIAKNAGIKIVAPMHSEAPPVTTPLVVSKKAYDAGQYHQVSDLRGKKVAINAAGSATEYWLSRALAKGGLTLKDVEVQYLQFSDVPAALENGAIAASMLAEPIYTLARDKGQVQVLSDDFISNFYATVLIYNSKFATERPAAAQSFMDGYLRACRDLQGDAFKTDAIAQIIEKYTKVPADVAKRSNAPLYNPNGRFQVDDLETMQKFYFDRGGLTYTTPLDMRKSIDTSFVDASVKKLGEYKR